MDAGCASAVVADSFNGPITEGIAAMTRFAAGLIVGLSLGSAGMALAAAITGNNGFLNGWSVRKGRDIVCQSPFVFVNKQEIDCH